MTPLMIAIVLATAVAALMFVVGSVTAERAEVRDSLRRLEGYQIQDVRDQEMLAPISERVVAPLLEGLTGVARRFTPAGFGEGVAQKLVMAGNPPNLNVDKVLVLQAARHRVGGALDPASWSCCCTSRASWPSSASSCCGARRSCTPTC